MGFTSPPSVKIAFAINHTYVKPSYVAIKSLIDSNDFWIKDEGLTIYVLADDFLPGEDRVAISSLADGKNISIEYIPVEGFFDKGYEIRNITHNAYYRLALPWLLPNEDKILYLDGDIIVRGDIRPLYNADVCNNYLLGVKSPVTLLDIYIKDRIISLGLDPLGYINSGVLLINCRKQRRDNLINEYRKHENIEHLFQDQDIINIVCKGNIGFLPPKYNLISDEFYRYNYANVEKTGIYTPSEFNEAYTNPVIIHYAGPKPWNEFTNLYREWWRVFEKTPFYCRQDEMLHETNITEKKIYNKVADLAYLFKKRAKWMYNILSIQCSLLGRLLTLSSKFHRR